MITSIALLKGQDNDEVYLQMCRAAGDGDRQAREPSPSSASSAPRTSTASPCSYPAASRQGSFLLIHTYIYIITAKPFSRKLCMR